MISFSKPEYVEELKLLWKKTFGDSERYVTSFFDKVYEAQNTLVHIENGHAVAALYMIPYYVLIDGEENRVMYLYALATASEFRGRKIMSALIKESLDICAERDYALSVLVPAEDTLAGFYRQFGYEYSFTQVKITKTIEDIKKEAAYQSPIIFNKANAEQIWHAYCQSIFAAAECIVLSKTQNEFYIDELEKDGGEALLLKTEEHEYYALIKQARDNIIIYETNIDSAALKQFYSALLKRFIFKTVTFIQPICFNEDELHLNKRPFAMSKKLKDIDYTKPFLNRVLT